MDVISGATISYLSHENSWVVGRCGLTTLESGMIRWDLIAAHTIIIGYEVSGGRGFLN